jgi:hypothetical protein
MSLLMHPASMGQKVKKFSREITMTPTSSRRRVMRQRLLAAVYPAKPPPKMRTRFGKSR